VTVGLSAVIGAAFVPAAHAAAQFGDWGSPQPVVAVNDPVAADGCPIESPNGNELYIASTRSGGDNDIWVASRSSENDEFGAPVMLPEPVNSDAQDFCPTPLPGKGLLFVSTRGGTDAYGTAACGGGDIYLTRKSPATGEWSAPRNLGCAPNGPNGPGTEYGPSLVTTEAGTELFFSSGGAIGTGTQDIYVSEQRADGTLGARSLVSELNAATDDAMPNLRKDGLEIVFASTRAGGTGSFDIWTSTRSSVFDTWSAPVNVTVVNTAGPETRPSLSWDGERLYLGRAGEIYVSHR
jgi:hypothetical protein